MENENEKKQILFPNIIVWDYKKKNKYTYLSEYSNKVLHVFSYLAIMTNRFNETHFTIDDLITKSGMTPKNGVGKVNNQFRSILSGLQNKGIIITDVDFSTIKINALICCRFNMPFEKEKDKIKNFFPITYGNYLKIMEYSGQTSKLKLLEVFYYINARLKRKSSAEIKSHGGKAETFYDTYSVICNHLNITETTLRSCIKELQSMGLLYFDNIGLVKKKGSTCSKISCNVYCLNEMELKEALIESKQHYLNIGDNVLGIKSNTERHALSGLMGKIKQLENAGQDTEKLEKKLCKLDKKNSN